MSTLGGMASGAAEHHIELIVQRVDGSLCGSARDRTDTPREFTGWLGLLGVLEALLADPESVTPEEP